MNENMVDEFKKFRDDIIEMLVYEEGVRVRFDMGYSWIQDKWPKKLKTEEKKYTNRILDYRLKLEEKTTLELLLEVIQHVSKDIATQTSQETADEMQHRIARAINSVNSFD
jgi:hypothetical protein